MKLDNIECPTTGWVAFGMEDTGNSVSRMYEANEKHLAEEYAAVVNEHGGHISVHEVIDTDPYFQAQGYVDSDHAINDIAELAGLVRITGE